MNPIECSNCSNECDPIYMVCPECGNPLISEDERREWIEEANAFVSAQEGYNEWFAENLHESDSYTD